MSTGQVRRAAGSRTSDAPEGELAAQLPEGATMLCAPHRVIRNLMETMEHIYDLFEEKGVPLKPR